MWSPRCTDDKVPQPFTFDVVDVFVASLIYLVNVIVSCFERASFALDANLNDSNYWTPVNATRDARQRFSSCCQSQRREEEETLVKVRARGNNIPSRTVTDQII